MKKVFKCLMAACMMLSATAASAQFVDTDNYTRVQASFVSLNLSNLPSDVVAIEPKGFSLGLVQGYSLTDAMPIFLEFGANLTWAHSAKDGIGGDDITFNCMNVAVPVNGVYKYTLNDRVAFSGHAGLNFKLNLIDTEHIGDEKIKWLDKDDMGGRDNRANIFQLGGQIGAGVHLSDFYVGWQFQSDFMKLLESENGDKHRFHANFITIGYQGELW